MASMRTKNTTKTAPTAIERVELFLDAHGGYTEPITSIRFWHDDYETMTRVVTRTPLSAKDLHELVRLAKIGAQTEGEKND